MRLCYRPNHAARALVMGKTNLIGLCVGDFNTYSTNVITHVEEYLSQRGFQMIVQRIGNLEHGAKIIEWPLDGLLTLDFPGHNKVISEVMQNQIPIVSIGSYSSGLVDHVTLDLYTGAMQALKRLIEQNYTRIIYVTSEWGNRVGEARHDAYFQLLEAEGMEPELLLADDPTREAAYDLFHHKGIVARLQDELKTSAQKTGIYCFNDEIALGVYRALTEARLKIPTDVALVGCDDIRDIQYLECPLSTISYSIFDLCASGVDLLEKRIKNPGIGLQRGIVASRFIERKSSAEG